MKTAAVIAEFNPLHNGHAYFLSEVRKRSSCDHLIAVMSGDFVQRGEPAILDKYCRTEMALAAGCSLVLELPVRHSCGSAPVFGGGAVSVLESLGVVDELWFGAETDDPSAFEEISSVMADEPASMSAEIKEKLKSGLSYPRARAEALRSLFGEKYDAFLSQPNNILGLEYCTALKKACSNIAFRCMKRSGQAYNDGSPSASRFASASSIRNLLLPGNNASGDAAGSAFSYAGNESAALLRRYVPDYAAKLIEQQRSCMLCLDDFSDMLNYRLISADAESLCEYDDINEELAKRIIGASQPGTSFTRHIIDIKSKKLTYSHISRALMHIVLGLKGNTPAEYKPEHVRILGIGSCGPLLHQIKEKKEGLLISKPSLLKQNYYSDDLFASNLYETVKVSRSGTPFTHEYSMHAPVVADISF